MCWCLWMPVCLLYTAQHQPFNLLWLHPALLLALLLQVGALCGWASAPTYTTRLTPLSRT